MENYFTVMNADLFEILTGTFMDGTPIEAVPRELQIMFSIKDNLTRLFNTRLGSNSHMPDYGLPDVSDTYISAPSYQKELAKAIKDAMYEYEPRMKNVEVREWSVNNRANLECQILGTVKSEKFRFVLKLISLGTNKVEFFKQS